MWNKALSKEGAAFIEGWHLREQMRQTETMAIRKIIKMHMRSSEYNKKELFISYTHVNLINKYLIIYITYHIQMVYLFKLLN